MKTASTTLTLICLVASTVSAQNSTLPTSPGGPAADRVIPISYGSTSVELDAALEASPLADLEIQSLPSGGLIVIQSAGATLEAGLRVGDIILRMNGEPLADRQNLDTTLRSNGSVVLEVQDGTTRQRKNLVLTSVAGTSQPSAEGPEGGSTDPSAGSAPDEGPTLSQPTIDIDPANAVDLEPPRAQPYRLRNLGAHVELIAGQGMLVRNVFAGSMGERMDLIPGDVILRINSTWTIDQAFDCRGGGAVEVQVDRGGQMMRLSYVPRYRLPQDCPTHHCPPHVPHGPHGDDGYIQIRPNSVDVGGLIRFVLD